MGLGLFEGVVNSLELTDQSTKAEFYKYNNKTPLCRDVVNAEALLVGTIVEPATQGL